MAKKTPLYQRIYSELKTKITANAYPDGEMFPSERALKDEYKVSHLTIRKALAQLVEEKLIERKTGIGTVVTFNNDTHMRRPQAKNIRVVSIILEEADDYFSKILNLIEAECRKHDMRVMFYTHLRDEELMIRQYERAAETDDSAILLFPVNSSCNWLKFHPALPRTIIVDEHIPGLDAPQIISDDVEGMFNTVKYLADMGHKKIAHVSSEAKTTGRNRIRGYKKAVKELALEDNASLIANGSFLAEPSYFAFEKIMRKNPDCTACACANDNAALGVMKAMRAMDLQPGKNFSLTGYGNYDISDALELTSVDQQVEKISLQIMFLLEEFQASGKMPSGLFSIPTDLKIRKSCLRIQ